jgi:hypothetical protein
VLRSAAIATLALAALALFLADWQSPARTAVEVVFLFFGPGLALTELLPVGDVALRLAIATGASLAADTLVAVALLYAVGLSAEPALAVLVGLTLATVTAANLRPLHD